MKFDHSTTYFPLQGRHVTAPCRQCHASLRFAGTASACSPIVISVIAAIREDRQDDDRPQAQHWKKSLLTLLSVILLTGLAFAQDVLETMLPVTYVSVALIYVDGGRTRELLSGTRSILLTESSLWTQ